MRIAIDARLNAYRRGGIPQYTRHLLGALAEAAPNEQFTSLQHREHLRPLAVMPNVTRRAVLTPPHHRLEQWMLPLELLPLRPALLHCPDFIAPIYRPWPAVVTIHDLAFQRYPEILDDAARAYYGQIRPSTARAEGVIAVSEATRQDVVQFLDLPPEQVSVVYEAAAPLFRAMDIGPGEVRVLNGEPIEVGSFLLFVSTLEPRKNLPTLLQALRVCLDRRPERRYRLVVAGGRGWRDEPIFAAVRDLRLGDHVHFTGGVGQYDLRWLYNACRLYINPSLYEGFGLPLLEAMACGAACLAADTSSLPEIGGDAAVYVPPLDVAQWADTIDLLWDDQERRAELGRRGQVRALRFSWQRAAHETLAVYRQAISRWEAGERRRAGVGRRSGAGQPSVTPAELAHDPQAPRLCLRCGTRLVAGQPHPLGVLLPDVPAPQPLLALVCPHCGQTELVLASAVTATAVAAPEPPAAPPAAPPPAPPADAAPPPEDTVTPAEEPTSALHL